MSNRFLVIVIVCLAAAFLAVLIDRRAAVNAPGHKRYRYGYFVVLVGIFALAASAVELITVLGAGQVSISSAFVVMISLPMVLGIARRRRYGWVCLLILISFQGALAAWLLALSEPLVGFVIAALILVALVPNVVYAARRWVEMRQNAPASNTLQALDHPAGSA